MNGKYLAQVRNIGRTPCRVDFIIIIIITVYSVIPK